MVVRVVAAEEVDVLVVVVEQVVVAVSVVSVRVPGGVPDPPWPLS